MCHILRTFVFIWIFIRLNDCCYGLLWELWGSIDTYLDEQQVLAEKSRVDNCSIVVEDKEELQADWCWENYLVLLLQEVITQIVVS